MEDLLYGAIVALAEFLVKLELTHVYLKGCAIGKVDAVGVQDGLAAKIEGA
jgi:hypothetical protein